MPKPRESLRFLNVSELAELCGRSPATVSSRLLALGVEPARIDGKTKLYDSTAVLELKADALDPRRERARLDAAKRELLALQIAEKRGELVPALTLEESVLGMASMLIPGLRAVPTRAAAEARIAASDAESESIIRKYQDEALEALAAEGARIEAELENTLTEQRAGAFGGLLAKFETELRAFSYSEVARAMLAKPSEAASVLERELATTFKRAVLSLAARCESATRLEKAHDHELEAIPAPRRRRAAARKAT